MLQAGVTEKHYQLMVNALRQVALIILDSQGQVISWNPGAEQIKGYTAQEIVGRHFSCFYPPEDIEAGKPQRILEAAVAEGLYEEEDWRVRKDGTRFWANVIVTPLYESGQLIGFSKLTRDLTRRRQAEDQLQQTIKELADLKYALDESAIVAATDLKGTIIYVNDTFCRISKYTREELLGQNHRIVNSGYHPRPFFEDMWRTISRGKVWKGEIRNRAKDGTIYWVYTTIVPLLDARQKPYQYISIRFDISDRKRVEAEIRKLNEEMEQRVYQRTAELEEANAKLSQTLAQLQESERIRSTFVSALTHDLRTPLVAQERALELFTLNREKLPPRLATLAERLVSSNAGLLQMVNLLLETYQYEAGKIQLLWESVELAALVKSCFDEVEELAKSKQIALRQENLGEIRVPGDKYHLKRVLMNLIGNALENIPAGCCIEISASQSDTHVVLEVADDGPGIAPDMLPHLFERYYIGDITRKKIGTGLGLYICRMIMELHQGAIQAQSQPGKGTCFTLTLPKKPLIEDNTYDPDETSNTDS